SSRAPTPTRPRPTTPRWSRPSSAGCCPRSGGCEPVTVEVPAVPWDRVRRLTRHVGRSLGPVLGLTAPALVSHKVWQSADDGRGTGVVVAPGFAGADASMGMLRRWLTRRGYMPTGAGLGINVGCTEELVDRLEQRVAVHADRTDGPVVLVGHSRGGMLARI